MRIGLVCPYSFDRPGGVQNQVLGLAEQLTDRGHYVEVLGPGTDTTDKTEKTEKTDHEDSLTVVRGGRSIPIPFNGSVARLAIGPQVLWRTRRFIKQGNFDILHIHEPLSPSYSFSALTLARGPIVATFHAAGDPSKILRLSKTFTRPAMEKIRGAIAVSPAARRWEVSQLGGDPVIIPNGLDVTRFARPWDTDSEQPNNKTNKIIRLTFVGRLDEPRKGLSVLLRALAELDEVLGSSQTQTQTGPSVICTIVGGGKQIPFTGTHVQVNYVGEVFDAEKIDILQHTDIAIAPNTGGESFGIVVVEAMAAGCVVIASDIPAFRAVVGDAGLLFRTGDSHHLCERILQLTTTDDAPARRRALATAATEHVGQYDWQHVTDAIERVYDTVATDEVVSIITV